MKKACVILLALAWGFTGFGQDEGPQSPDLNQDGVVGINDLMLLLSAYGQFDADFDGVWDHVDDCVGTYDACAVCNGPGPTVPIIDEIVFASDSAFNESTGAWEVFEWASDTLFTFACPVLGCTDADALNFDPTANVDDGSCDVPVSPCEGIDSVTFDGHTYGLVSIGEQCWFAENLRTEHYRNGDAIASGLSVEAWSNTHSGAVAVYGEGSEGAAANLAAFGRLFNWYAVSDPRGVCPNGWHVPTDAEFSAMVDFLGGSLVAALPLKSSPSDEPSWDGTNASGFSALAGGSRTIGGGFNALDSFGYFWSVTSTGTAAWSRRMSGGNAGVSRLSSSQRSGFSVRCVRDE
jgi:uncharacterized protein (TIGR02145 family)